MSGQDWLLLMCVVIMIMQQMLISKAIGLNQRLMKSLTDADMMLREWHKWSDEMVKLAEEVIKERQS